METQTDRYTTIRNRYFRACREVTKSTVTEMLDYFSTIPGLVANRAALAEMSVDSEDYAVVPASFKYHRFDNLVSYHGVPLQMEVKDGLQSTVLFFPHFTPTEFTLRGGRYDYTTMIYMEPASTYVSWHDWPSTVKVSWNSYLPDLDTRLTAGLKKYKSKLAKVTKFREANEVLAAKALAHAKAGGRLSADNRIMYDHL